MPHTKNVIRNIYLYLVSAISLFMIVFATVSLVNLGLRTWVFPLADNNYSYPMATPQPCVVDPTGKSTCQTPEQISAQSAADKLAQDQNRTAQRERDLIQGISFLIVAVPVFMYHWSLIRRDRADA